MSKYGHRPHNWFETIVNKLGGEEAADRFLHGEEGKPVFQQTTESYELYRHEKQSGDGWIKGVDLENHLRDSGLLGRTLSLDSYLVKEWIAYPETYPEELKGIYPCLWGSAPNRGGYRGVPYLVWDGVSVFVYWSWLDRDFYRSDTIQNGSRLISEQLRFLTTEISIHAP